MQQDTLSLDSASYTITPEQDGDTSSPFRIDLPMRAFDNNFHVNLKRMYDYLNVKYISPKFIYPLSTIAGDGGDGKKNAPHFIHSSSNHQFPPIRPESCGYVEWILRMVYLAVFYFWFTTCCFFFRPKPATGSNEDESLQQYLERIRLPRHFSRHYLLPLMSSVTTCSHDALLNFPAIDCVEYAKKTYRQPHYVAVEGVQEVQTKIAKGRNIRFGATVTAVENTGSRVRVSWTENNDESKKVNSAVFDHVIMAVPPNVVGAIYQPLQGALDHIPVAFGESVVHRDTSTIPDCGRSLKRPSPSQPPSSSTSSSFLDHPQVMHICSTPSSTESIHEHPSSILVTNFPISPIDPTKVIHRARFTRVLRTPKSRALVERIFSRDNNPNARHDHGEKKELSWRNGDGNVWLVGAWCWDGMVLLEGCIVSAMRVAGDLGVEVPWMTKG